MGPLEVRKILSPVDFSDVSRRALRQAGRLARLQGASLTVMYVYQAFFAVPDAALGASVLPLDESARAHPIRRSCGWLARGRPATS